MLEEDRATGLILLSYVKNKVNQSNIFFSYALGQTADKHTQMYYPLDWRVVSSGCGLLQPVRTVMSFIYPSQGNEWRAPGCVTQPLLHSLLRDLVLIQDMGMYRRLQNYGRIWKICMDATQTPDNCTSPMLFLFVPAVFPQSVAFVKEIMAPARLHYFA